MTGSGCVGPLGLDPELRQRGARPPIPGFWRLRHDEDPAFPQERGGSLRGHRRGPERPGDGGVVCASVHNTAPRLLGSPLEDLRPVRQAETVDRRLEEPRPPLLAVEEKPGSVRAGQGNHQTRHAPTAAKVDDTRPPGQGLGESKTVFHVKRHGTRPEEPGRSSVLEDAQKL